MNYSDREVDDDDDDDDARVVKVSYYFSKSMG